MLYLLLIRCNFIFFSSHCVYGYIDSDGGAKLLVILPYLKDICYIFACYIYLFVFPACCVLKSDTRLLVCVRAQAITEYGTNSTVCPIVPYCFALHGSEASHYPPS